MAPPNSTDFDDEEEPDTTVSSRKDPLAQGARVATGKTTYPPRDAARTKQSPLQGLGSALRQAGVEQPVPAKKGKQDEFEEDDGDVTRPDSPKTRAATRVDAKKMADDDGDTVVDQKSKPVIIKKKK